MGGKQVKLFLVDGTPGGLTTAEITNWTGHVVIGPRSKLADLLARDEAVLYTSTCGFVRAWVSTRSSTMGSLPKAKFRAARPALLTKQVLDGAPQITGHPSELVGESYQEHQQDRDCAEHDGPHTANPPTLDAAGAQSPGTWHGGHCKSWGW